MALARAAYSDKSLFLLDDPLSAVDAHVGKHIVDNLLGPKGMLRRKTRVLVTHSVGVLPKADRILFLENGKVKEEGTYEELMQSPGSALSQMIAEDDTEEEAAAAAEGEEDEATGAGAGAEAAGARGGETAGIKDSMSESPLNVSTLNLPANRQRNESSSRQRMESTTSMTSQMSSPRSKRISRTSFSSTHGTKKGNDFDDEDEGIIRHGARMELIWVARNLVKEDLIRIYMTERLLGSV